MHHHDSVVCIVVATLVMTACGQKPADTAPSAVADLIITGGRIITMEGDQPTTVEAIVVDDGRITFVGNRADALAKKGDSTVLKDLGGKTLMPGFIDGHAHAQQFGTQAVGANLLAPPDGTVNTIDDLVDRLKSFAAGPDVALTGWIFGIGYDDALLGRLPYMVKFLAPSTQEGRDSFLKRGLETAKSYGYTTNNEGRMFGPMHDQMADAARRGLVDIDFIGWMDYTGRSALDTGFSTTYANHYRLGGLKITLDGSPQGRTAWRTVPYLLPPDGQKPGYKGYPAIPDTKQVEACLDEAYGKGWLVKVHANGDAAIDQLFEALKPVIAKHGVKPGQVTLIHGQFIRPDQVQALKSLGIFPSMFPMHTFYWGDWYEQIVGPEQAAQIAPMRSILNTSLHATSHTDAPVALPNLMQVVWATVNRTSRSGTITMDPAKINQVQVLETIKEGKAVWVRD